MGGAPLADDASAAPVDDSTSKAAAVADTPTVHQIQVAPQVEGAGDGVMPPGAEEVKTRGFYEKYEKIGSLEDLSGGVKVEGGLTLPEDDNYLTKSSQHLKEGDVGSNTLTLISCNRSLTPC